MTYLTITVKSAEGTTLETLECDPTDPADVLDVLRIVRKLLDQAAAEELDARQFPNTPSRAEDERLDDPRHGQASGLNR